MKEIPLTQSKVALVDDEDYERVLAMKWHADRAQSGLWYAITNVVTKTGRKKLRMQNFILNPAEGSLVDHHDGDGLNNQKRNLRQGSRQQNSQNRKPNSGKRFKGVHKAAYGKYRAVIFVGTQRYHLGRFVTEEEGARAYDAKARELFGEFARLNFPEEIQQCQNQ